MKKLLVALAVVCMSSLAFAFDFKDLDMSAGLGFNLSPYFHTEKASNESDTSKATEKTTIFGVAAFFDATYAQVSLGLGKSSKNASVKVTDDLGIMGGDLDEAYNDYSTKSYLSLGVLGKYPFPMSGFTLFPLLGFEYDLNIGYKDNDGNDLKKDLNDDEKSNLNMFWLKLGGGADIPIAKKFYVRPEVLVAYKLKSKLEKDRIDDYEDTIADDASITTIKVDIGVLVGYKLK
jgi:hypothetical protein